MAKVYDPVMCMMVERGTTDASWKAWSLFIDGKFVKSFNSEMPPIKEAQKYMKENRPGKVAKLARNTGSASGYTISEREAKDSKIVDEAIRTCDEYKEIWQHYKTFEKDLKQAYNSKYPRQAVQFIDSSVKVCYERAWKDWKRLWDNAKSDDEKKKLSADLKKFSDKINEEALKVWKFYKDQGRL